MTGDFFQSFQGPLSGPFRLICRHYTAMGCICVTLCRKGEKTDTVAADEQPRKQYSWEMAKANVDPKDFTVKQLKDELVIRQPGTINGQQFIVQDCQDCRILLLDHINVVTIDDCKNCQIVLGPTRGSVFIRNSENCRLVAACQQFRARDCLRLRVSLLCSTQPSIEFCSGLKFSCIQLNYKGLKVDRDLVVLDRLNDQQCSETNTRNKSTNGVEVVHPTRSLIGIASDPVKLNEFIFKLNSTTFISEQIAEAQLSPFTNFWYEVYDFTPSQVVHNWTYSKGYTKVFTNIRSEQLEGLEISEDADTSAVPRVHGTRKCTPSSHDRVLIFNGKDCEDKAFKCLKILTDQGHHLVRSSRLEKNKAGENLDQILGEDRAPSTRGPLVVLHLTGDELPDGVTQQNNIHTSCDHQVMSALFTNSHRVPTNGVTIH